MSELNKLLRIDRLRLENFRCFGSCELQLHRKLTVLVADNARGKTALLDALRIALNVFVASMGSSTVCKGFERADMRLEPDSNMSMRHRTPTFFGIDAEVDGELVNWRRMLGSDSFYARNSNKGTYEIRRIARRLVDRQDKKGDSILLPTLLPIVAYYGTGRLYDEHRLTEGKRWLASASPARTSAYLDCLSPSSSFKSFAAWYGQKWEQVRDPLYRAVGFEARPENQLAAVREAVRTVLKPTGWDSIDWTQPRLGLGYLAVEHAKRGRLPLTHLSDGVRTVAALVGDLAHRCVRLNPFLGEAAASQTPGVVLIDEVDMHLHPRWQQQIVGLLQAAFPNVQFVMTTHSPEVLTTVKRENIRQLKEVAEGVWTTPKPDEETKGVESASALANVMNVDPVPPVQEALDLSRYRQLIQLRQENSADGQSLRSALEAHFGVQHPLMLDCARLIRLEQFKATLPPAAKPQPAQ